MAEKIRGITIEISADTNPIMKAFKEMDASLKDTDKALKDVNKLLKFDSSNVTLLQQKQEYLQKAIAEAGASLKYQKDLLANMPTDPTGKLSEEQKALTRNIEATQQKLNGYKTQLEENKKALGYVTENTNIFKKAIDGLKGGLENAKEKFKEWVDIGNIGSDIFKSMGSGLVDLGKDMFDLGLNASAVADDIMTLSTQIGLSTDTIQEFKYMSELTDTSLETITGSMKKLTMSMTSANNGSKTTAKAFETLGVSIYDVDGNMRDTEDVFREAIDQLGQIENETERDSLAMQIFGRSASDLNPLIAVGAEGLAEYANEAHEVGYVLDNETLESLGDVDDAVQRAKKSFDAVKTQLGVYLAPVIADLTEAFIEWAKSVDWEKVGNVITRVVKAISSVIKTLLDIIKGIINWGQKAKDKVVEIADAFKGKWELPKVKLPHFAITPKGWKFGDLLKGTIPKLSVEFYRKGMEGMVLDGATIFGMNRNGQLMVGGEAGREIIIGEKNLLNAIQNLRGGTSINVVVNESVNAQQTARYVISEIQYQLAVQGGAWR